MSIDIEAIDHDADAGFEITADSLPEIFRAAAMGMLDIILDRGKLESRTTRLVAVEGESADLLLVNFLAEILSIVQGDRFGIFDIEMGEVDENLVVAEVSGQRGIPEDAIKTEIKQVTYHQLEVERTESGVWKARVIFDL